MNAVEQMSPASNHICTSVVLETSARTLGQVILVIAGTFFAALGIVGMFLPLLPTTCFLLLATWCYAKSSPELYHWMLHNKWFGAYLRNYREGRGIPRDAKLYSMGLMWLALSYSGFFAVHNGWIQLLLGLVGLGVTLHVLSIPTLKAGETA